MHRLKNLEIINFRSCISCSIELSDFTPMVGCNNVGKSNILDAISWLISPSSGLSETDFYDTKKPVIIRGTIEGIGEELLADLNKKHLDRIKPYCSNEVLKIQRIQEIPSGYKKDITLYVRNPKIPADEDENSWDNNPTGIDQAISAIFPDVIEVEAMKDAGEDVSKYKTTTTIGKLISKIMEPIRKEQGLSIKEALEDLTKQLDCNGEKRPKEVLDFDKNISDELETLFPGIELKLHIPTPEFDDLFKSGTLKAYEGDSSLGRDITCLGHGAQRSIHMALIRYLSKTQIGDVKHSRQLLLVEEPELYLHPQAIEQTRFALKHLSSSGYQVIYSTHSPIAIASEDIPYTLLVRKTNKKGTFVPASLSRIVKKEIADAPSQADTIFSLSHSSQILFSDKVVLAEGKTERRLLPFLFEFIFQVTLGYEKIALIDQGGASATGNALKILKAMNIPTKAIVDLDFAFRDAIHSGLLNEDDKDIISCLEIFKRLSLETLFNLDENGLPTRTGSELTPSEAFSLLSQDEEAQALINNIHTKLLKNNVWIWKFGNIEQHLGINGKSESSWAHFRQEVIDEGFDKTINKPKSIKEMFDWLRS